MMDRVFGVAMNTYREAVRARLLHGLAAVAVLTLGYCLVVGAYALGNSQRVIADLGSASISVYSIVMSVVIAGTSLYRELELKTIFPILARPMGRGEYIVGKFLGTWLTLGVFVLANSGILLLASAAEAGRGAVAGLSSLGLAALVGLLAWLIPRSRTWLPVPTAALLFVAGVQAAAPLSESVMVIAGQSAFTLMEAGIVTALALLFAAFSSPFLSVVFTLAVVLIGRSADTLASLPVRTFGAEIQAVGRGLAYVFPNLMVYVPTRAFLTGQATDASYAGYMAAAGAQAVGWMVVLLFVSTWVFRRRDFL